MIEICPSRALGRIVELDEEEIKVRILNRIRKMSVRNETLGGTRDVVWLWLLRVKAAQGADHGGVAVV